MNQSAGSKASRTWQLHNAMVSSDTDKMAHILLVEDEPGILESLRLLLELEGYRVSAAGNGHWALESLAHLIPDLVVTDYAMPFSDGGQLIESIRAHPSWQHLPVILMSGVVHGIGNVRTQADIVLQKPLELERFFRSIRQLLE